MASVAVVNPTIVINNIPISIQANSAAYDDGLGEQSMRAQSAGGGAVDIVYSENVESNISMLKFSLANTATNIELARDWKKNRNANAATLTGEGLSRSFNNMALLSKIENVLSSDGSIDIEFSGDPAV